MAKKIKSTVDVIQEFGEQLSNAIVIACRKEEVKAVKTLTHLYKYTACLQMELEKHIRGGHDSFLAGVLKKDLHQFMKTETFLRYQALGKEGKSDVITEEVMKNIQIMDDCLTALNGGKTITDEAD